MNINRVEWTMSTNSMDCIEFRRQSDQLGESFFPLAGVHCMETGRVCGSGGGSSENSLSGVLDTSPPLLPSMRSHIVYNPSGITAAAAATTTTTTTTTTAAAAAYDTAAPIVGLSLAVASSSSSHVNYSYSFEQQQSSAYQEFATNNNNYSSHHNFNSPVPFAYCCGYQSGLSTW